MHEREMDVLDQGLIVAMHRSGRRFVGSLAGGGVGGLAAITATPGASRSLVEGVVPYSLAALKDWLGGTPDQACSEPTARAMAMAAWRRAMALEGATDPANLAGVACTASLATDRPKRGAHRIHVGLQTAERTQSYSLHLKKDARDRAAEEQLAAALFLLAGGVACQCDVSAQRALIAEHLLDGEDLASRDQTAPVAWQQVLLSGDVAVEAAPAETATHGAKPRVIFPGAFHPPHQGHLRMAELSEQLLGEPVAWEVSLVNVDKPPLDWVSVAERVAGLQAADARRAILLSPDATFDLKAARWPGATFVTGIDTLVRIADGKYYGDDPARRDQAIDAIAGQGCRFLVFGRLTERGFSGLDNVEIPGALRELCQGVDEATFRVDVSSTEIREGT